MNGQQLYAVDKNMACSTSTAQTDVNRCILWCFITYLHVLCFVICMTVYVSNPASRLQEFNKHDLIWLWRTTAALLWCNDGHVTRQSVVNKCHVRLRTNCVQSVTCRGCETDVLSCVTQCSSPCLQCTSVTQCHITQSTMSLSFITSCTFTTSTHNTHLRCILCAYHQDFVDKRLTSMVTLAQFGIFLLCPADDRRCRLVFSLRNGFS